MGRYQANIKKYNQLQRRPTKYAAIAMFLACLVFILTIAIIAKGGDPVYLTIVIAAFAFLYTVSKNLENDVKLYRLVRVIIVEDKDPKCLSDKVNYELEKLALNR